MEAATAPARKVPVMEWRHVAKRYPKASGRALSDVSFVVHPGEIVVLVGPNGSGKTTAMEMISALRLPTSGEVLVNGEAVRPPSRSALLSASSSRRRVCPSDSRCARRSAR